VKIQHKPVKHDGSEDQKK